MPAVAKPRLALYMTSSFMPEKGRNYERFLSHFKKYGWNLANLRPLMQDMQGTIKNLEKISSNSEAFRITFCEGLPNDREGILLISGHEILANMKYGPQKFLEFATHNLSYLLIETLFEEGYPKKTELMLESIRGTAIIDFAVDSIVEFYINERQANLGQPSLRRFCYELIESTGRETVSRKFAYQLLRPKAFNGREIEAIIDIMIADIHETVNRNELGISEFESMGSIAGLAVFATLAKKAGNVSAYLKCHDLLYGKTAEAMAWIEFAQIEVVEEENIPKDAYPATAVLKIEQAVKGYRLLFNTFQRISEYYYDNVEIR